jgi:uncharacterized protein (DUF1499 family)
MHLSLLTTTILSLALLDCPASPNCVSSQAAEPARRIEPLAYPPGQDQQARNILLQILHELPRTTITEQSEGVIKAVVQSALFRFKDDLEFHFDQQAGLIHLRSAARTGYWDLGVNRRRVEHIRSRFNALLNTGQSMDSSG